jgi:hypothetical protein
LAITVTVKTMASQRWPCLIHLLQFNETSCEKGEKAAPPAGGCG